MSGNSVPYFKGQVIGLQGIEATCLSDKKTGISAEVQSRLGAVKCFLTNFIVKKQFKDIISVELIKFGERNKRLILYTGPINPRNDREIYESLSDTIKDIVIEYAEEE